VVSIVAAVAASNARTVTDAMSNHRLRSREMYSRRSTDAWPLAVRHNAVGPGDRN